MWQTSSSVSSIPGQEFGIQSTLRLTLDICGHSTNIRDFRLKFSLLTFLTWQYFLVWISCERVSFLWFWGLLMCFPTPLAHFCMVLKWEQSSFLCGSFSSILFFLQLVLGGHLGEKHYQKRHSNCELRCFVNEYIIVLVSGNYIPIKL